MPPTKHRTARLVHVAQQPERPNAVTDNCQLPTDNSSVDGQGPTANGVAVVHVSRQDLLPSLRRSIEGAAPEMVNAIIAQGKEGSYLHTKFLFEFAGLSAAPAADTSAEQSLAATLLRALALNGGPQPSPPAPNSIDSTMPTSAVCQGTTSVVPQPHQSERALASAGTANEKPDAPSLSGSPPDAGSIRRGDLSRDLHDRMGKPNGACKPNTTTARA